MMKMPTASDLRAAPKDAPHPFEGVYAVRGITARTARNGAPFWIAEFGDRSGTFGATIFQDSPVASAVDQLLPGAIARVRGATEYYQDRFSPRLDAITMLDPDQAAADGLLDGLMPVSPEDPDQLETEFREFCASIAHAPLRATVEGVLGELDGRFRDAPAAVSMHHAYRHGLLEHTVRMARACDVLAPLYPEVDRDLAMAGILVHDSGKVDEYTGPLAPTRTRTGLLQGHVVLGFRMVRRAGLMAKLAPDLLERLEHIVLSHQGEPAWGAAVYAATPEAVFVSMIDNLDAKMGMVQFALRETAEGQPFSDRMAGLNGSLLVTDPEYPDDAGTR